MTTYELTYIVNIITIANDESQVLPSAALFDNCAAGRQEAYYTTQTT